MHPRLFRLTLAASLFLVAGCTSFVKMGSPDLLTRTQPGGATHAAVAPEGLATQPSSVSVGVEQAPVCQASLTCAALDAEQIPLSCVKKVPYTNVLVPQGTTFEVVDQSGDFVCLDTGVVVNGKEVLTCHGTQLYSFQLRLTNAACSDATLAVGTGQCDDGFGYDAEQKCCAPLSNGSAGSTIVTVSLGACPVPNP